MPRKTTIDIREPLLEEARKVADAEGASLRSLVEEGLELAIARRRRRKPFRLRDASYKGRGTQPGVAEGDWGRLRSLVYEGRGD